MSTLRDLFLGEPTIGDNTPMTSVEQGKVDFTKVSGKQTFKAGGFFAQRFLRTWQTNRSIRNNQTADPQTPGSGVRSRRFF